MARSALEVRVISESDDGAWAESNVQGVVELVRRGYELLVGEDIVARAVEDLEDAIDAATDVMVAGTGNVDRLAEPLGIPEEATPITIWTARRDSTFPPAGFHAIGC